MPLLLSILACSLGTEEVQKSSTQAAGVAAKEPTSPRAIVEPFNVEVPQGTHSVSPADRASDYNVYPAENDVMLQGIASGPIGDHKSGMFWVSGVHSSTVDDGPSYLEAVMVYPVECDDCPGEDVAIARIESSKSTEGKSAELIRVKSMKVVDLDKNGTFEVLLETRFRPCCDGDSERFPYTEAIVLKVEGDKIERWAEGEVLAREQ